MENTNTGAAPEGWQLVPIKPTDEMALAACKETISNKFQINGLNVWNAMLAAAPVAHSLPLPAEKDALTAAAGECELVKRTSDQSLTLQFTSCRAASAFEKAIRAVPPTWQQKGCA